jgi:hypothetical protein
MPFAFWSSLIAFLSSSTGNTDIITNSVIILFICEVDELLYSILMASSSRFKRMLQNNDSDRAFLSQGDDLKVIQQPLASSCGVNADLEGTVASLTEEVRLLIQKVKCLEEHSVNNLTGNDNDMGRTI